MAYVKIQSGWTLSDGILPKMALGEMATVRDVLIANGYLKKRPAGLEGLFEAWYRARTWRYEAEFTWTGEDEWCALWAPKGSGSAQVWLNGELAGALGAENCALDMTFWVREGENQLALVCAPGAPEPGINGPIQVRASVGMTLANFELSTKGDAICARVDLCVHAQGRYQVNYKLMRGDAQAGAFSFTEELKPGARAFEHALPVAKKVFYDRTRSDESTYLVKASIERMGIGCLQLYGQVAFVEKGAGGVRAARYPGGCGRDARETRLQLLWQLGVNALVGAPEPFDFSMGFLPIEAPDVAPLDQVALIQAEDMAVLAGSEKYWPAGGAIWRLTESVLPDEAALERQFGPNAAGDAARCARFTRFLQAERVRAAAIEARKCGAVAWLDRPFEARDQFASTALVEFTGAARPAYDALQEAWKTTAISAILPAEMRVEPGAQVKIPVWLFSAGEKKQTVAVEISCLGESGAQLAAVSLPTTLGEDVRAGELSFVAPPEDAVLIVRCEVVSASDGVLARCDQTLCVTSSDAFLSPLMNLKSALLREKNGRLTNEGNSAALCVSSAGYRALLPGESMPCLDTYECLNWLV
ncbi:MAG: hypothetical protein RSJ41_03720 [Clostridia bacterium]